MENKDIIQRIIYLLQPNLDNTIDNLELKDIDYFIEHITLDLNRSIQNWKYKKNDSIQNR